MPSVAPEAMLLGRRSRLVVLASTAYIAAAAVRTAEGRGGRAWGAALIALGIAWATGARERWTALASWGLAIAVASSGAPEPGGWVGASGVLAACAGSFAAVLAVARVTAPAGIAHPRVRSPLGPMGVLAVLWAVALAARGKAAWGAHGVLAENAEPFATTVSFLVLAALVGDAWWTARERRLELGVAARMHAAAGLAASAGAVGLVAAFLGLVPAEIGLRVGVALASLLVVVVSLRGDPEAIARGSRRAIALAIVGGPVVMLGAGTAEGRPWDAPAIVAVIGLLALAIGMAGPYFEEPLRPARGAWLDAVASAHEALLRTDPDEAVREALVALRAPAGLEAPSPQLWTFDPMRVTTVDAAAYAHTEASTLPEGLVATAAGEPEAILRHEVLDAFQVRRAELRPYVRWMDDHGTMLAAVVTRAGEAEGLLVLPRGRRAEALTLEEARVIKRLADALAALCHARAALARSLERERRAEVRAEGAELSLGIANHELERRAATHVLAAERLARPATIGIYSAAARFAFDAIEGARAAGRTLFVHAPSGIDAVPYIARSHLASPRRGEPFVVVDGTSSREHDPGRWVEPLVSPLALADRGLLLLVDGAALPPDVQRIIARALAERRLPWEREAPLDVALAMTAASPLAELITASRLEPALAARFDGAAIASLPGLRDRPEDLRAILSDRLAREGLRVRGTPVGIDDAAFARLLEHTWDAEDAELAAIAQRLVATCDGDVVRGKHVDALITSDPALRSIA